MSPPDIGRAPCGKCNLPLLASDSGCPRCAGAHFKDLAAVGPTTVLYGAAKPAVAPEPPAASKPVAVPARRRCGGKPVGKWGKLTDDQLMVLYRHHTSRGLSIRHLARQIWGRVGYASEGACLEGIRHGWKRLDLPARTQGEATAAANVARRAPDSPGTADRAAYKRWLRAKATA